MKPGSNSFFHAVWRNVARLGLIAVAGITMASQVQSENEKPPPFPRGVDEICVNPPGAVNSVFVAIPYVENKLGLSKGQVNRFVSLGRFLQHHLPELTEYCSLPEGAKPRRHLIATNQELKLRLAWIFLLLTESQRKGLMALYENGG